MTKTVESADSEFNLETERLTLERFTLEHASFLKELMNSPGWLQYIGDRGVYTVDAAERYIRERFMVAYVQYGYGFRAVRLKEGGQLIGGCGLIRRDGLPHPDIGFALLPEFAGRSYGYEMAMATLDNAREAFGLPRILGITLPANTRSIRLLERIGLQYEKMIQLPGDEEQLMLFGMDL